MARYEYNLDVLKRGDDVSWYLLGALMTDGCVSQQRDGNQITHRIVTLASMDLNWLERIRDMICPEMPISKYGNCNRIQICSTELCSYLIGKGCTPAKSLTLQFPDIPNAYMADFMRGCIDGDGSIHYYIAKNTGYMAWECDLTSASPQFVEGFGKKLDELGFRYTLSAKHPSKQKPAIVNGKAIIARNICYRIRFRGYGAFAFVQWLYYDGHRLSLPRKAKKAKQLIAHYAMKRK